MASLRDDSVLVIVDGGLESLVASLLAEPREKAVSWFVGGSPEESDFRRTAARMQAELLGLGSIREPADGADFWTSLPGGLGEAAMLLAGVNEVIQSGLTRLLWPKHASGDLDSMLDGADRALLIQRLGLIEQQRLGTPGLRIDTPLIDLSDLQVADLAVDLDAPVWSCWWAMPNAVDLGAADAERRRWTDALKHVGGERLLTRQGRSDAA